MNEEIEALKKRVEELEKQRVVIVPVYYPQYIPQPYYPPYYQQYPYYLGPTCGGNVQITSGNWV